MGFDSRRTQISVPCMVSWGSRTEAYVKRWGDQGLGLRKRVLEVSESNAGTRIQKTVVSFLILMQKPAENQRFLNQVPMLVRCRDRQPHL